MPRVVIIERNEGTVHGLMWNHTRDLLLSGGTGSMVHALGFVEAVLHKYFHGEPFMGISVRLS